MIKVRNTQPPNTWSGPAHPKIRAIVILIHLEGPSSKSVPDRKAHHHHHDLFDSPWCRELVAGWSCKGGNWTRLWFVCCVSLCICVRVCDRNRSSRSEYSTSSLYLCKPPLEDLGYDAALDRRSYEAPSTCNVRLLPTAAVSWERWLRRTIWLKFVPIKPSTCARGKLFRCLHWIWERYVMKPQDFPLKIVIVVMSTHLTFHTNSLIWLVISRGNPYCRLSFNHSLFIIIIFIFILLCHHHIRRNVHPISSTIITASCHLPAKTTKKIIRHLSHPHQAQPTPSVCKLFFRWHESSTIATIALAKEDKIKNSNDNSGFIIELHQIGSDHREDNNPRNTTRDSH